LINFGLRNPEDVKIIDEYPEQHEESNSEYQPHSRLSVSEFEQKVPVFRKGYFSVDDHNAADEARDFICEQI
jgi:hypothetical protein